MDDRARKIKSHPPRCPEPQMAPRRASLSTLCEVPGATLERPTSQIVIVPTKRFGWPKEKACNQNSSTLVNKPWLLSPSHSSTKAWDCFRQSLNLLPSFSKTPSLEDEAMVLVFNTSAFLRFNLFAQLLAKFACFFAMLGWCRYRWLQGSLLPCSWRKLLHR